MKRITTIGLGLGLGLVAALALGAFTTTPAFAGTGPLWAFCGWLGGNTHEFETHDCTNPGGGQKEFEKLLLASNATLRPLIDWSSSQTLRGEIAQGNPFEFLCLKVLLLPGAALIGTSPGTDLEQLLYDGCELTTSGLTSCKINGEAPHEAHITTKPLLSRLVYLSELAALMLEPNETGTLFLPETGKIFAEFTYGPIETRCAGEGELKLKNLIILGNGPEAESVALLHLLVSWPTPLLQYYNGNGEAVAIRHLEFGGFPVLYLGLISLLADELGGLRVAWWIC